MSDLVRKVRRAIGRRLFSGQVAALTARIERLEDALAQAKAKNEELARQLNQQRDKTRELYARTKDYAARLKSQR